MSHYVTCFPHTIMTERVVSHTVLGHIWRAYLDDDRRTWEAGESEAEAIGKLVITRFPTAEYPD